MPHFTTSSAENRKQTREPHYFDHVNSNRTSSAISHLNFLDPKQNGKLHLEHAPLFHSFLTTFFCFFQPKVKTKPGQENKLIHPKSRKAEQISREWHRQVRVKNNRKETATKLSILGEKIAWFRDNLPEDNADMTNAMTAELIEKYLARFDEEVEQIQMKNQIGHRSSRQHASREDSIALTQKLEKQEFETCGLGK